MVITMHLISNLIYWLDRPYYVTVFVYVSSVNMRITKNPFVQHVILKDLFLVISSSIINVIEVNKVLYETLMDLIEVTKGVVAMVIIIMFLSNDLHRIDPHFLAWLDAVR